MSDTPRTEANRLSWKRNEEAGVSAEFARGLERELNEANARIKWLISERDTARGQAEAKYSLRAEFEELLGTNDVAKGVEAIKAMQSRIKRLIEAGDKVILLDGQRRWKEAEKVWNEAKESK